MAAGRPAVLKINILADADRAVRELDRTEGKLAGWGGKIAAGAGAALGVLAGVGAGLASAVKAAAEDADGLAMLVDQLERVTGAVDVSALSAWVDQLELATGVADDQLRPALSTLATVTGDLTKAQELLQVAMDISAATGRPLEAVTTALAKAADGNTGALARLGIPMADVNAKLEAGIPLTQALSDLFGGAAATKADTYGGKLERVGVAFSQIQEKLGEKLLPYLEDFVDYIGSPKFQKDLETMEDVVNGVADGVEKIAGALKWVADRWNSLPKGLRDFLTQDIGELIGGITKPPDWWPGNNRAAPAARALAGAPVTVNVYGALDPDGVATQLNGIMAGHARRAATAYGW